MRRYRKLPTPEVLKVHGVFSLEPGWYKTGRVTDNLTETDTVVEVTKEGIRWYKNEKLHREDGPAVEYPNGDREWWLNDKWHREDGPAVEKSDGTRRWFLDGKPHREDGPAYESPNGTREWWLSGKKLNITTLEELQAILMDRKGG